MKRDSRNTNDSANFSAFQSDCKLIYNTFFPTKFNASCVKTCDIIFDENLHKTRHFTLKDLQKSDSKKSTLFNTSIISIGANLKNPLHTFKILFLKLQKNAKIHILSTSPIFKNPPFGYKNQPFFYNATILLATKMCLLEFYAFIFYMERIFGRCRKRAFKNAPRSLDIDIIFFNDIFLRNSKLNIPHPKWQERLSVLIPLIYQVNYKGF